MFSHLVIILLLSEGSDGRKMETFSDHYWKGKLFAGFLFYFLFCIASQRGNNASFPLQLYFQSTENWTKNITTHVGIWRLNLTTHFILSLNRTTHFMWSLNLTKHCMWSLNLFTNFMWSLNLTTHFMWNMNLTKQIVWSSNMTTHYIFHNVS